MVMTREGDNRLWCGCSDGSILVFDLNVRIIFNANLSKKAHNGTFRCFVWREIWQDKI